MLSLLLLVITGIWMTVQFGIGWSQLFSFQTPIEKLVSTKLALLLATIALAISAQVRVIPSFKHNSNRLPEMAVHAAAVTIIGISMLVIGSFGRYGGI